jgi:MYXO-CTERM domain-containing protein
MRTFLALVLLSGTASAHITMTYPTPRTTENKTEPCGAASRRSTRVTRFAPGETITVAWDETVDHPGHYRIAFDDDGDDDFVDPKYPDDNFPFTLVEPIPDKVGGRYTQSLTLPATPCTNCTLQLMQIMTTQVPYNSFYYQCADIIIGEGGIIESDGDEGGGCSTSAGGGWGAIVLLAGLLARRRRRDQLRASITAASENAVAAHRLASASS